MSEKLSAYEQHQQDLRSEFQKWQDKYPLTFKHPVICGIGHPNEWDEHIQKLCSVIESHLEWEQKKGNLLDFKVTQTKAKFGYLCFYTSGGDAYITGAIHAISKYCIREPY